MAVFTSAFLMVVLVERWPRKLRGVRVEERLVQESFSLREDPITAIDGASQSISEQNRNLYLLTWRSSASGYQTGCNDRKPGEEDHTQDGGLGTGVLSQKTECNGSHWKPAWDSLPTHVLT